MLGIGAATPADAAINNQTGTWHSAAGQSSYYHVIANGIDWSKPVGAVFYFDGDYWYASQSKVEPVPDQTVKNMAAVANARNMVFIALVSPDTNGSGDGYTWWENPDANGDWFRSVANKVINEAGIDRSNIWTVGYSGGAEFIAMESALDRQHTWRTGGGDLMIGGGGNGGRGMQSVTAASKNIPMYWYVGSQDGSGATWPATWSAYGAAHSGRNFYVANGFTRTQVRVQQGINHYQYNHAEYLRQVLDENKRTSGYALVGGIRAHYYANGGASVFGQPTGNEFASIAGGYIQNFSNARTIYWTPHYGSHSLYWRGAIGSRYASAGFERAWGYPTMDEQAFWHGAKQWFVHPVTGYNTAIYWSAATGAHTMNGRGAIFNRWASEGDVARYGFPVTDETMGADGIVRVKFANGQTISWTAARGTWVS